MPDYKLHSEVSQFFIYRVQSYIKNGWAGNVINPDEISSASCSSVCVRNKQEVAFSGLWESIQTAFKLPNGIPALLMAT